MNHDNESHLSEIKKEFAELVTEKYRKGAIEHGGYLWLKNGLLDMAIDEAIDQVVYLLTLRQQQKGEYFIKEGLVDIDE